MEKIIIVDTDAENILKYGVCGYKNKKRAGYQEKIKWLNERFQEGLKLKTLYSDQAGTLGMIEYIPGEYCWRPVNAKGYMFIHCIFSGFKKIYKGKGYGSLLVNECIKDAEHEHMNGVAVVTRKGSFMAGKELFLKKGFEIVDKAPTDFELLVKKINTKAVSPKFKANWENKKSRYQKLTIIRADQCPYTVKNVKEIKDTAQNQYGISPNIITLKNSKEAQESPCAFGTFCILYEGKVLAEHPISNKRFMNIMNKIKR